MRSHFPFEIEVNVRGDAYFTTSFLDSGDFSRDAMAAAGIVYPIEDTAKELREERRKRSERSKRGHANRMARLAKP